MRCAPRMHSSSAVVTGVSRRRGIGRVCVQTFLKAGYRVVGIDVKGMDGLEGDDSTFKFIQADLTNEQQLDEAAEQACSWLGNSVNVLINNAGIAQPFMPGNRAERKKLWHQYLSTNLTAAFMLSEATVPHMPPGNASIIHISSTRAKQSEPQSEGYGSSKAGLLGLTHSQAVSLGVKVRVNAILPGYIHVEDEDPATTLSQEDHEWHLTGKVGSPDDIAELCLFLSDKQRSGFITGQHFTVDGGVSVKMVYPE